MAKWENPGDPSWEAETAINNAYAELAKKQIESKKNETSKTSKTTNSKKE